MQTDKETLKSKRKSYQISRDAKKETYDKNQEKLKRLYKVKNTLQTQKGYAEERKRSIKRYADEQENEESWKGKTAETTRRTISESIVNSYDGYVKSIDNILDRLCDEINRIENENYKLDGDIFYLRRLINNLTNEIEKMLN